MRSKAIVLTTLLVVAGSAVPAAAATPTQQSTQAPTAQQSSAYAGTHVAFETTADAVVDYSVNNDTVIDSMSVQSQGTAEGQGDTTLDAGLSGVTDVNAAAVSLDTRTDLGATVTTDSGATIATHDNEKGILVVSSGNNDQYVMVNVSSETETERESNRRVVVTTDDGTEGTFIVAGDGAVTVNERGNLSANLTEDSSLVFRSYPDERDDDDRQAEQLIANGTAAAEVTVMETGEDGSELAADVANYSQDTSVEVTRSAEGTVNMTATRTQEDGRVIISSVSEQAISATEDLQVTVDGEAAAEASSYSELESATNDGENSRFLVSQRSEAEASADVFVALNHFSSRDISMQSDDTATDDSEDGTESTDNNGQTMTGSNATTDAGTTSGGSGPGFGALGALLAIVGAMAIAVRHNE